VTIAEEQNVKHVVLLNVPAMECETVGNGSIRQFRQELNVGISELVDIAAEITFHDLSDEEKMDWWCDGLHLTKKGYKKVAELISRDVSWLKKKKVECLLAKR